MITSTKCSFWRRAISRGVLFTLLLLSAQVLHAYVTLSGTQTEYVLKGDTTYFVSGSFTVNHLTIEGGAVVKYDDSGYVNSSIIVNESVNCKTDAYRPAIFTSRYDASVGEVVSPAGSIPSYRRFVGLKLKNPSSTSSVRVLQHLRFRHAHLGVFTDAAPIEVIVRDSQFYHCTWAVGGTGPEKLIHVWNVLVDGDKDGNGGAFTGWTDSDGGILDAQHVTVHQVRILAAGWESTTFTNTLVVDLTVNPGSLPGAGSVNLWDQSGTTVFESVGAGGHYLPDNSPYRDAGTGDIAPGLLASISTLTTDAPELIHDQTLAPHTYWFPQAQRDAGIPDVGYHYAPLDYLVSEVTLDGPLSLYSGVAIGFYGTSGLKYGQGGPLYSEGTSCTPNRIVWYPTVQEGSLGNISPNTYVAALKLASVTGTSESLGADIRRTHFTTVCHPWYIHVRAGNNDLVPTISFRDCEFSPRGYVIAYEGSHSVFINCLFDRTYFWFDAGELPQDVTVEVRNCLFRGGLCNLYGEDPWRSVFTDNLFDRTSISGVQYADISHNGYTVGTVNLGGVGDVGNVPADFLRGPSGDFYYSSTMNALEDVGSRDAAAAGLYNYTTRLDQTPEYFSQVDIGYHYPAATAPQAYDNYVQTCRNTPGVVSLNTWDECSRPLMFTVVDQPDHGTLSGQVPSLIYTPNAGFEGPDSFTFKVSNGFQESSIATISIAVGYQPWADSQSAMVGVNASIGITLSGGDSCDDPLTYAIDTPPTAGNITGGTASARTYTPNSDFEGQDSFTFKTLDGYFESAPANIMVLVVREPGLTGSCRPDRLILDWTVPQWVEQHISDFLVKRSITPGGPYTVVATVAGSARHYEDTSVTPGTTYYYTVTFRHVGSGNAITFESPASNEIPLSTCACPAGVFWTDSSPTAQQMAQWLMGPGVTINNATISGSAWARGVFRGGTSAGLPLASGIILSAGDIVVAEGPNDLPNDGRANGLPGDSDLDALVGGSGTLDAVALEFDIITSGNSIQFQYVFGSEEYEEWVGSFNDPVGIFVNGVNVALVPDTTDPVSVNTINAGVHSEFYRHNENPANYNVQYDGLTTLLTATASVTSGVSAHVKIVIADYGDQALDSGVLLKSVTPIPCDP